jgi:hypothetical protein
VSTYIRTHAVYDWTDGGTGEVFVNTYDALYPDGYGGWGAVAANFDAFHDAIKPYIHANLKPRELRHYRPVENPTDDGSPIRIDTLAKPFNNTAAPPCPTQVAMSITERTGLRRHWGRVYLPGLLSNQVQATGRWNSLAVAGVAAALAGYYNVLVGEGIQPIVVTTVRRAGIIDLAGWSARGYLPVELLQIDDVPDVIRRRRLRVVTNRHQRDVNEL